MVQDDHRTAGCWSRLRSASGRWCLATAVSAIAGAVSLFNAASAQPIFFHLCVRRVNPPCTSCPKNPGTATEACSRYLNGWQWGYCSLTSFSITCYPTSVSCSILRNCKTGADVGNCSPGGMFSQCNKQ